MSTSFLDFNELKTRVSIEQVLQLLGITLKQHNSQLRGCCPIHKGTDQRGFVVTPAKDLFIALAGAAAGIRSSSFPKCASATRKKPRNGSPKVQVPFRRTLPFQGEVQFPQNRKWDFTRSPTLKRPTRALRGSTWPRPPSRRSEQDTRRKASCADASPFPSIRGTACCWPTAAGQ